MWLSFSDPSGSIWGDPLTIGKLKGAGKVWQITACDAATSYGVAAILPALAHEAVGRFLRMILVPLFQHARPADSPRPH